MSRLAEFLDTFKQHQSHKGSFIIDLSQVEYIDSSGLGMLLSIQSHRDVQDEKVRLINCCPEVKKILKTAQFQSLFTIE